MAVTSSLLRLPPCSVLSAEISTRRRKFATIRCAQVRAEPSAQGEKRKYKDSFTDLVFINGCRQAFGRVAGWQSPRSWEEGYEGMVEVSHALARNRNAAEQQAAVLQLHGRRIALCHGLLQGLAECKTCGPKMEGFPKVPNWFRKLFPYSDWGAQLNARITPLFFSWLVGPCEIVEVTIKDKTLKSGVQIEKCRYLETSGCTGLCVNSCKMPTQYFFTTELGMPLTMEPNFEDMSCLMIFGQTPPPPEQDVVFKEKCCSTTCPTSNPTSEVCPKLR